ncbi:MAG: outer membrane protein assembly factor BamA [Dysgonamonadaceae bacterium]|jgi:outer membrane protein insertion porin family|nr:outer membrane protein assembly factor BamA [Dysgonamonadaceae bacterium]
MFRKILLFGLTVLTATALKAQEDVVKTDTIPLAGYAPQSAVSETQEKPPVVSYSLSNKNKKYAIAQIKVSGVENSGYEDYILVGVSGLQVGQRVAIPGDEITAATRQYWKNGLFSDVQIEASKMTDDSVWLEVKLKPAPLVSNIEYHGVKKGEREDLEAKIGMVKNIQINPNIVNRIKIRIKQYFDEKGFSNAGIAVRQYDDVSEKGKVILDITIDKNEKTKIKKIYFNGNEALSDYDLKTAMKKTNEGNTWQMFKDKPLFWARKLFSTKKFVEEEYKNDLIHIIEKYNEKGYRDAEIVSDSVSQIDDKHVAIHINLQEGDKYYIRNVSWVGNTEYPSDRLSDLLDMKEGDVYNQTKLNEKLNTKDDAIINYYSNEGYIFAYIEPVETHVENDSIDLEIRISEGRKATLNRVIINGNDRLYEDIIRRELITKPGQLFNKEALMSSLRELAQMGHFDPEHLEPKIDPNQEAGTVDISYNLTSKANDQVEFSAGWGQTGVIGKMSLKFSNFSFANLLHPSTYKGIIPQGEGQTLTLSGQTNGKYYQSYSISFFEPWFGGRRPNSFSLSAYYMVMSDMDSRYYQYLYNNPYYYSGYGYGSSYDYSGAAYDENKSMKIIGISAGYGKRLSWPDYLFNFMAELSFQHYILKDWAYFLVQNGTANDLSLGLTLSRNSTDNPLYTRSGSQFSVSVYATPPYSLWDGLDYASMSSDDQRLNRWIEYHKWKFKGKIFIPLASYTAEKKRTPVLMSRAEYGFLGSYNSHKVSPFQTFYVGGDGMTGYSSMYATETVGLRGYGNGALTPSGYEGYGYSRLTLEFRYPFMLEQTSTIYGLVFLEAGNAWHDMKEFNPFKLKRSAGVGARIYLPMIGLMGIDWGYGFDQPFYYAPNVSGASTGISGSQFHFILGQEF